MKRYMIFFLSLTVLLGLAVGVIGVDVSAQSAKTDDGLWEYTVCGEEAVLTAYLGTATDVYVPYRVKNGETEYAVVKLGDSLFANNDGLNSATLAEGITEIGAKTFYDADNLVCIVAPESLTTIGAEAFYSCDSFNSVILYDAVSAIGENAFAQCPALTIWCNENTTGHTYATGNNIFYEILNPNATPEIVELNGVTYYVGNGESVAISAEKTLTEVVIPAEVNGNPVTDLLGAFKDCTELVSVTLPVTLENIGISAFENCTKLQQVNIPENVSKIGENAFRKCSALTEIVVSESVAEIGKYAFSECSSLTEVTLPKEMTKLGTYAFSYCSKLKSITFPMGITVIPERTFYNCKMLTGMVIPEGVTTIGEAAFYDCAALQEVKLPETLQQIRSHAFHGCKSLQELILPDSLTTLGNYLDGYVFARSGLIEIVIPEGVEFIPEYAFWKCEDLEKITLPESLRTIDYEAFSGCKSLKSIRIPSNVCYLGDCILSGCSALESIIFCADTDNEDYECFGYFSLFGDDYEYQDDKPKPKSLTITGNAKTICNEFKDLESLTELVLTEGVKRIESGAFKNCEVQMVIVPQSLTGMEVDSFHSKTILGVYENSYAHTFAAENDLLYFVIRKTENPEISYGAGITGTVTYTNGTAAVGTTVEILYDDGIVKETVVTDENGAYTFTYAEVGQYTVRATDSNGSTAMTKISVKRMNAFDVFLAGDTELVLKLGNTVSGMINGSGTVTLTDENGDRIALTETTDGSFSFENVPNGTYILGAQTEAGSVSQEITVFNSDLTDITLTAVSSSVTLWGYTEVQDREGTPHRRNWVQVTLYNAEGIAVAQGKTNENGMYRFTNLPMGQYAVVAEATEMRQDQQHSFERSHTLTGYGYIEAAEIGEYQVDTIVLYEENDHLTKISGKVTANGQTQDCEVVLRDVFRHEIAKYSTGKNGKYSFKNVRDGLYFITATTSSDGMGYAVVTVCHGKVYGEADIRVYKTDKIKTREASFASEVPVCEDRESALKYRDRIAEEKRFYDSLSEKEKKQLSKEYVQRLNRYVEWIAQTQYDAEQGVTVEQGGLVVSGDELDNDSQVTFAIHVEKVTGHVASTEGVQTQDDFIHHAMNDTAGKQEIQQYYEITMTKTVDGTQKQITNVRKDTETTGKFRIVLPIPEEYRGYMHYSILHEHCGEVVRLADLDDDPDTITIEVDAFSTFALTATNEALTAEPEEAVSGDITDDGVVSNADVVYLLWHTLFPEDNPIFVNVDFNGDGYISNDDTILLLWHVLFPEQNPL